MAYKPKSRFCEESLVSCQVIIGVRLRRPLVFRQGVGRTACAGNIMDFIVRGMKERGGNDVARKAETEDKKTPKKRTNKFPPIVTPCAPCSGNK